MKAENFYRLILAGLILPILLACNALVPVPTATPSPLAPAATSTAQSEEFIISTLSINEKGESSDYTINGQYPAILENTDPRALAFNEEMHTIVQGEIDVFKASMLELPPDPNFAPSSFDVEYNLLFQGKFIVSIKFDFSGYTSGAAHPYQYTITVNYDLEQGQNLALDELFLPGSNYLEVIADHCIAELSQRDIAFDMFSEGAAPTPDNYRNWNITSDGLLITFDEYQVAPYAAGAQMVVVPYGELQHMINPQGPLAAFTR